MTKINDDYSYPRVYARTEESPLKRGLNGASSADIYVILRSNSVPRVLCDSWSDLPLSMVYESEEELVAANYRRRLVEGALNDPN